MSLSDDQVLSVLQDSETPLNKRDISQALNIKGGPARIELKQILKSLEEDGRIVKQAKGEYTVPSGLPSITVVEVTEIDIDGDMFARPAEWDEDKDGPYPTVEIIPPQKGHPALQEGDRALVALKRRNDTEYEAKILRPLDDPRGQVLGLVERDKNYWLLSPANKKAKYDFDISQADLNGAEEGDIAIGEIQPARGMKRKKVRVVEVIGRADDPKAISLLSLHEVGLRNRFPDALAKETRDLKVPELGKRQDLRTVPLITIDGADAKDFDDAVYAEPTEEGYHIIVAIADVAYYVRPDSALDQEAYARGNSTYFPDRVVPMLPEALSNDLCSLRPEEPRACLAAHLWIDEKGKLTKHKFVRGLMESHARCTYEQVQAFRDHGKGLDEKFSSVIDNLYAAYHILDQARDARGALDLDLPEREIQINDDGDMTGVRTRTRLDAHKLIEEFMILANVAAAQALEFKDMPCVYRVHEPPNADKVSSASEFLDGFGMSLPKGENITPKKMNYLLARAEELPYKHLIHQILLRTQSQANYSPQNEGHFGLALKKYAHFTSPIRRYADLLIHRALIRAYDLGPGGLSDEEMTRLEEKSQHISETERTSVDAERNANDRFTAAYLSEQIGAEFSGRISGVTRFGLFITLDESGADGIVPIRTLGDDYYEHDEHRHALIGKRKGKLFRLGADVTVRLKEADGLTGSTVLELVGHKDGAEVPGFKDPKSDNQKKSGGKPGHKPKGKGKPAGKSGAKPKGKGKPPSKKSQGQSKNSGKKPLNKSTKSPKGKE